MPPIGAAENDRERRLGRTRLFRQPRPQDLGPGSLMAQRLQEPHDAVAMQAGSDQRLHHLVLAENPGAKGIKIVAGRSPILDDLFQQGVIEIREMVEQVAARLVLAQGEALGQRDELRGRARDRTRRARRRGRPPRPPAPSRIRICRSRIRWRT